MNWLCVVVGGVAILGGLNWHLNSRHHFSGPKRAEDSIKLNPLVAFDQLSTVEDGSSVEIDTVAITDHNISTEVVNE